jgi:ATP-dependent exoDNAse (exonuclease V) beta subunit
VLDWIRAAERGGQVLLPDVVRLFEKYIKTPPRGGAAEALLPDPEQNAVTLMTVHGAKGLTKRVCFVPDISFGDQSDKGFAVFSASTLELKLTGLSGEEIKSPGWDAARKADKAVRDLESVNVFYVAMTRARDLVVLSGAGTQKPDGWLKLSEAFLQSAGPEVLRKLSFAEMPGIKGQESGVRDQDLRVSYIPLRIPSGVERRTVTSLCEHSTLVTRHSSLADPSRYGTIGHAVLEELARNAWHGDIPALVELFSAEFGEVEDNLLIPQLEAARDLLRKETAGAAALFTEHPFVLKRGNVILDGTIDLLAQLSNGWKIFDYKFTNETPENALAGYSPQLEAYREAVQKLYPDAAVSVALVLIGDAVQIVSLRS